MFTSPTVPEAGRNARRSVTGAVLAALGFAAAPIATAQFSPPANVSLGVGLPPNILTGIASGDIDDDGIGDVLGVDNVSGGNIGVARGLGGGVYSAPIVSGPLPASAGGVTLPALGDFDLDGFLDVSMAGEVGGTPALFVARANPAIPGAFIMPAITISLANPGAVTGLRITDANSDGDLDLLASVIGPNRRIDTVPGWPGLTFGPLMSSTTSTGPADIDICVDADHDGDKDVVLCGLDSLSGLPRIQVMFGNNTLNFTSVALIDLPPQFTPLDVHWFDCDQDRFYDIVVACQSAAGGALFRIRNSGAAPYFQNGPVSSPPIPVTNFPTSVLRLESNFDGVEDLSIVSLATPSASISSTNFEIFDVQSCVLSSAGTTGVGTVSPSTLPQEKFGIHAVDDQDHDGREDLLIVDQSTVVDRVLVYRNIGSTDFTINPVRPRLAETTPVTFRLQAPPALTGAPFIIFFSIQGTFPPIPVAGQLLPLHGPFLPFNLSGTVGPGGQSILTTPPVSFSAKPVGFSLQVAAVAIVTTSTTPVKIQYISHPAVITIP